MNPGLLIGGRDSSRVHLNPAMANRHGIISGATGSGKTITLQILAEGFSRLGVPVFMADVKGDLSGIATAGSPNAAITGRLARLEGIDYHNRGYPTLFWDLYGNSGHPIRATISDLGPLLLSRLLDLNETQTGVLYSAFRIADDNGLLLLDLKDLTALLRWIGDHGRELRTEYGSLPGASLGAIQRRLLMLEEQDGDRFFGEPALQLQDLCNTDFSGQGVISLLDASALIARAPQLYATFLLWLLSELFQTLPEIGDLERPRLVLFFDEAHLLFERSPRVLLDKIEQVVRLIRSKGVGVYFISQSPLDIPETILGQLGLRIQHTLRAYTPKERKTVAAIAAGFRPRAGLDTARAVTELGIGEALVSVLNPDGSPSPVERILIRPPESHIGPLSPEQRRQLLERSPLKGRYDAAIDRESAYERLKARAQQATVEESGRPGRQRQGIAEAMIKSAARSIGSQLGRQLIRGLLGSLLGGRR